MTALQGWIVIGLLVLIMLGIVGIGTEIKALPYLWRTHDVGLLNPIHRQGSAKVTAQDRSFKPAGIGDAWRTIGHTPILAGVAPNG